MPLLGLRPLDRAAAISGDPMVNPEWNLNQCFFFANLGGLIRIKYFSPSEKMRTYPHLFPKKMRIYPHLFQYFVRIFSYLSAFF